MKNLLINGFTQLKIPFTNEIYNKLEQYKTLLIEGNKTTNLTSILDEKEIAIKHFIDSLTILKYLDTQKSLIDIGTGAGFPGIVLKIVGYSGKILLLDSLNKRIKFLDEVIEKLDLTNIETIHMRAEDGGKDKKLREKFHYATSRAVAPLNVLCEYCLPFVKIGGKFIAMKGSKQEKAENSIIKLGGRINSENRIILPNSEYERNIIVIEKLSKTPKIYPRKAGTPTKKPL